MTGFSTTDSASGAELLREKWGGSNGTRHQADIGLVSKNFKVYHVCPPLESSYISNLQLLELRNENLIFFFFQAKTSPHNVIKQHTNKSLMGSTDKKTFSLQRISTGFIYFIYIYISKSFC